MILPQVPSYMFRKLSIAEWMKLGSDKVESCFLCGKEDQRGNPRPNPVIHPIRQFHVVAGEHPLLSLHLVVLQVHAKLLQCGAQPVDVGHLVGNLEHVLGDFVRRAVDILAVDHPNEVGTFWSIFALLDFENRRVVSRSHRRRCRHGMGARDVPRGNHATIGSARTKRVYITLKKVAFTSLTMYALTRFFTCMTTQPMNSAHYLSTACGQLSILVNLSFDAVKLPNRSR